MSLDSAIREQLSAVRRRDASRRILTEAIRAHHQETRLGFGVLTANAAFAAKMRGGRRALNEYTASGEGEGDALGLFDQAFQLVSDRAMSSLFEPFLNRILSSLGLDDHPRFREVISGIIVDTVSRMVTSAIKGEIPLQRMGDCEFISKQLALSTSEALPKALLNTFMTPGVEPTGVMKTFGESISNYFAGTETVEKIADVFQEFVCKVSFADLITRGADAIGDAVGGEPSQGDAR